MTLFTDALFILNWSSRSKAFNP